jgi:hypothetical protein
MEVRPVGAELYADGRTDMTKPIVAFRDFAKTLKDSLKNVVDFNVIIV